MTVLFLVYKSPPLRPLPPLKFFPLSLPLSTELHIVLRIYPGGSRSIFYQRFKRPLWPRRLPAPVLFPSNQTLAFSFMHSQVLVSSYYSDSEVAVFTLIDPEYVYHHGLVQGLRSQIQPP